MLRLQAVVRLRPPAPSLRASSWAAWPAGPVCVPVTRVRLCPASASLSAENRKWFSCLAFCLLRGRGRLSFPRYRQWVRGSS